MDLTQIAKIYAIAIKAERKTISDVPSKYRTAVDLVLKSQEKDNHNNVDKTEE